MALSLGLQLACIVRHLRLVLLVINFLNCICLHKASGGSGTRGITVFVRPMSQVLPISLVGSVRVGVGGRGIAPPVLLLLLIILEFVMLKQLQ